MDAVVCVETIEHIQDDVAILERFKDALIPGGLLLLSTPIRASGCLDDKPANPFHIREYTAPELANIVQSVGFRDVKVEPEGCHLRGFIFLTAVRP